MPSYRIACSTKDYHEDELLGSFPGIVSIAPRLKLDEDGNLTDEAIIVIGVQVEQEQTAQIAEIPRRLQCYDEAQVEMIGEEIEVEVVFEQAVKAQLYNARRRPCPGGFSIGHPNVTAGTLGIQVYERGNPDRPGFFITNNHVAADTNRGPVGVNILQPGPLDGGTIQNDVIGQLVRWVPITLTTDARNEADIALVRANGPWNQSIALEVFGIGRNIGSLPTEVGNRVTKAGRTTERTSGNVLSTDATVIVDYGNGRRARFVKQIQCTFMSQGGDSGSVLFREFTPGWFYASGLIFAGSNPAPGIPGRTYANQFNRAMQLLDGVSSITDVEGKTISLEPLGLTLTEYGYKPPSIEELMRYYE